MLALAAVAPLSLSIPQSGVEAAAVAHTEDVRVQAAREAAVDWLVDRQERSGRWESDAFAARPVEDLPLWDDRWLEEDPPLRPLGDGVVCWSTEDAPLGDVGTTGLAVLALVADGSTLTRGRHREPVKHAVRWLVAQQDRETGLIGKPAGRAYVPDHAIATLALCEVQRLDRVTILENYARAAVGFIESARSPHGGWSHDAQPSGECDTRVTTWMVLALDAAGRARMEFDPAALRGAASWYEEATDPQTGPQSGLVGAAAPRSPTEASLLGRLKLGQKPALDTVLIDHVRQILATLPGEPLTHFADAEAVLFGARATSWLGGTPWTRWSEAFVPALVDLQSKEGPTEGSWDPDGDLGSSLGRVGTTALLAWTLGSVEGAPADGVEQRGR